MGHTHQLCKFDVHLLDALVLVDFDCLLNSRHEIDTALVKRASKIAVDYKHGVLVRTLHLLSAIGEDYLKPSHPRSKLGKSSMRGPAQKAWWN